MPCTIIKTLAAAAAGAVLATGAFAQTAREVRGASPYVTIENEPTPKLIVDPPLPEGLALGVFWAQYRVENVRIVQVFGPGARQVSPRVGHLHITVDDLPWWWADASDNNTVDIAGLPGRPADHGRRRARRESDARRERCEHQSGLGAVLVARQDRAARARLHGAVSA